MYQWIFRSSAVLTVIALFALGAHFGFQVFAQEASQDSQAPLSIGTVLTTHDWEVTVTGTREETRLGGQNPTETYSVNPGFVFFIVEATFENLTDDETSISTGYPMVLVIDDVVVDSVGSGSRGSSYCLTAGSYFCVGSSSSPNKSIDRDVVFILSEQEANAPEKYLYAEHPPFVAPDPLPETAAITASNIEEVVTLTTLQFYHGGSGVFTVGFASDDRLLVSRSADDVVRLWDLEDNVEAGVFESVDIMTISESGSVLALVNADNTTTLWDIADGREIATLAETNGFPQFSPDETRIATGNADGSVHIWQTENGEELTVLAGHAQDAFAQAFSPDDAWFVSTGCEELDAEGDCARKDAVLWDMTTGTEANRFEDVTSASFSPDGTILVLTSAELDEVKLYDTESQTQQATIATLYLNLSTAFNSDSSVLAISGCMGTENCTQGAVLLWDVELGSEAALIEMEGRFAQRVAFSPDDTVVAAAGSDGVLLWNVQSPGSPAVLPEQASVAFNSDGTLIASGDDSGSVKLWGLRQE